MANNDTNNINEKILTDSTNKLQVETQYILLENSSNEIQIKQEGEHIFLEGIFTQFQDPNNPDDVNENGRVYTFEGKYPFKPHYEKLKHLIDEGYIVCGSLDHPDSDAAEMNTAAFVIEKYEYIPDKNYIWGKIRILNTMPYGHNAKEFLKAGKRIFISSRALGEIKEGKYASINQLITYDLVSVPGMKFAEMKMVNEDLNVNNKNIGIFEVKDEKTYKILNEAHERFRVIKTDDVKKQIETSTDNISVPQTTPIDNIETNNISTIDITKHVKQQIEINNTVVNFVIDSLDKLFLLGVMFKDYNPVIKENCIVIDYFDVALTFEYSPYSINDVLEIDISNNDPIIMTVNGKSIDYYKDKINGIDSFEFISNISSLSFGDIIWFCEDETDDNYFNRISKIDYDNIVDIDINFDPFEDVVKEIPKYNTNKTYLVIDDFIINGINWVRIRDFDDMKSTTLVPVNWDKYVLPKIMYKPAKTSDGVKIVRDVILYIENGSKFSDDLEQMIENNINKFKNINEIGKVSFNIEDENKIYRYNVKKTNENRKSFDLNVYITESNKVLYDVTYTITDKSKLFKYINEI